MQILPIEFAKPGLTLAAPVRHPAQPATVLLKQGHVLEEETVGRLRELGMASLYVEHEALAHLDRFLAPLWGKSRPLVADLVTRTFAALTGAAPPSVGYADYYAAGHEVVCTAVQKGLQGVYLEDLTPRPAGDQAAHATAVAHLAVMIGVRLEDYLVSQRRRLDPAHAKEVVNLAVAGMLHDVGKAKLAAELRGYVDATPPAEPVERCQFALHARLSYELVHKGIEASAATAILHHHQRFDGSGDRNGNPKPLAGDKIHVFARIIAAADLFDRLSYLPCGKRRRPNVQVLHMLRTTYAGWLDPFVLYALPKICLPFPPGSRVALADGSVAVVAGLSPGNPYYPVVWRVEADGITLIGEPLPTSNEPTGTQIRVVDGVDVSNMFPEELEPVVGGGRTPTDVSVAA